MVDFFSLAFRFVKLDVEIKSACANAMAVVKRRRLGYKETIRRRTPCMSFSPAPHFRPARLLRSGHAQTLATRLLPKGPKPPAERTVRHVVPLEDGDSVVLHDDTPTDWQTGSRAVLLVHGLAGSFESGYMHRTAARLNERAIRTFRMDMRGCGAAYELAKLPAHSGRVSDVMASLEVISRLCPRSPVSLFGFSLGGNLVLNTLAQIGRGGEFPVDMAITVCPPIDLVHCSGFLKRGRLRLYDRYFITALLKTITDRQRRHPELPPIHFAQRPTSLWDFDDAVTAPLCGFPSAEAYYLATAPVAHLAEIAIPTLLVAAENDPLIPVSMYAKASLSPQVSLQIIPGGGHLGFISNGSGDPDYYWLDWRLVEWTLQFPGEQRASA